MAPLAAAIWAFGGFLEIKVDEDEGKGVARGPVCFWPCFRFAVFVSILTCGGIGLQFDPEEGP